MEREQKRSALESEEIRVPETCLTPPTLLETRFFNSYLHNGPQGAPAVSDSTEEE